MANRSTQCSRLLPDGHRCTRPATGHRYCTPCWNLALARLKGAAPR